jgi:lipopolysaccharide/colanic/teichoic acid biosynthesis glycosyltransferase
LRCTLAGTSRRFRRGHRATYPQRPMNQAVLFAPALLQELAPFAGTYYTSSEVSHSVYPFTVSRASAEAVPAPGQHPLKRAFDLAFSGVALLLGLPVLLLIAAMVKLTSRGPVLFRQPRTGQHGKLFDIYKFRSMRVDADSLGLQHSQGDRDPRLTPIGSVLRSSRLDELPQFLNVLKGDMSIVGPRPLFKYDVDMLMEAAPEDFKRILTVKPGITSIGQIEVGYATTISENVHRMRHDLTYLRKYSLRRDIGLIGQTVGVMVLGRGR